MYTDQRQCRIKCFTHTITLSVGVWANISSISAGKSMGKLMATAVACSADSYWMLTLFANVNKKKTTPHIHINTYTHTQRQFDGCINIRRFFSQQFSSFYVLNLTSLNYWIDLPFETSSCICICNAMFNFNFSIFQTFTTIHSNIRSMFFFLYLCVQHLHILKKERRNKRYSLIKSAREAFNNRSNISLSFPYIWI